MAKTTGDSLKIEVWGSDRVAQGASALVDPSQSTIEKGFVDGIASANDFTWVPNILGAKVNHCLQNGVATWNNTTAYVAGNMVTHAGKAWQCLLGNTNSTPADGNANWDKMLSVSTPPTANSILPSQTGNSGRFLTTNGTNTSWGSITGVLASVNFDGTTAANLTGTFTRTGNTVTVNVTGHGHLVDHIIYFVGAGVTSNYYRVVSVVDANTFTFTTVASGAIGSTACTLQRRSIRKATNVQSIAYNGAIGFYAVNFTALAPDANYVVAGITGRSTGNTSNVFSLHWGGASTSFSPSTASFQLVSSNSNSGNGQDWETMHIMVFP
jgi:hypothetical protein